MKLKSSGRLRQCLNWLWLRAERETSSLSLCAQMIAAAIEEIRSSIEELPDLSWVAIVPDSPRSGSQQLVRELG